MDINRNSGLKEAVLLELSLPRRPRRDRPPMGTRIFEIVSVGPVVEVPVRPFIASRGGDL